MTRRINMDGSYTDSLPPVRVPRNEAEELLALAPSMPLEVAAEAYASTAGIERQEAAGAAAMVQSTVIPIKGSEGIEGERLVELGFMLGDQQDDLFRHCELPEGWQREGGGHSMWTYIVDERGFRRVAIFYKAAWYDRDAFMQIISEPETRAQSDAYEVFAKAHGYDDGWTVSHIMVDEIKVYVAAQVFRDDAGERAYIHGHMKGGKWVDGDWALTGLVYEMHVAPDGTILFEGNYRV